MLGIFVSLLSMVNLRVCPFYLSGDTLLRRVRQCEYWNWS